MLYVDPVPNPMDWAGSRSLRPIQNVFPTTYTQTGQKLNRSSLGSSMLDPDSRLDYCSVSPDGDPDDACNVYGTQTSLSWAQLQIQFNPYY